MLDRDGAVCWEWSMGYHAKCGVYGSVLYGYLGIIHQGFVRAVQAAFRSSVKLFFFLSQLPLTSARRAAIVDYSVAVR